MVAVFDLDGTLTWRDTLLPYMAGFLRRHPRRLLRLWRLPGPLAAFAIVHHDRGKLKSAVIRMVLGGETRTQLARWTAEFVAALQPRGAFRPGALATLGMHRQAGDHLVLLSASPDLYVPAIATLLGFERALCTELVWREDRLEGSLLTANRRGEEKSHCLAWLRTQYPGLEFIAYGNSASDLDHMRLAERALLVNADAPACAAAARYGIPTARWT